METLLRLCEGCTIAHTLNRQQRTEIEFAAVAWQKANSLRHPPLWFSGEAVSRLHAFQNFVGVVAAGDVTVEIYPKLDAALLGDDAVPDDNKAQTVLRQLMWMLEVGEHGELAETDTASLQEEPSTFLDLWTFLLCKRLLRELENGVTRTYQRWEADLPTVRGRIRIAQQVTRNWNRMDNIACSWDEFTPDTPLNRLLKCTLCFLQSLVRQPAAHRLLQRCLIFFEDVADVDTATALQQSAHFRWDRSTERFRLAFELARRLLQGRGHEMSSGDADTFVFLVNMANVFEDYVGAVLAAHFHTQIKTQKTLGKLFQLQRGGISQIADYFWQSDGNLFIGDAKYKHLTAGHNTPLRFEDIPENENEVQGALAAAVLSPADVRQLTIYAELARRKYQLANVHLLLLYPFVGDNPRVHSAKTWNNAIFSLVPIRLSRCNRIRDCLPEMSGVSLTV